MKSLTISLLLLSAFSVATIAHAALLEGPTNTSNYGYDYTGGTNTGASGQGTTLMNPLKSGTSLESFLKSILQFVIRIGTIAIILMLVFVGYKFVVAQGAPGAIEEARTMLLWTVIGALVLLGAQAIASAIQATVQSLGG